MLFLPGSSQADRSIPSLIKLSLDRPELGSNPHGSPLRQRRLIAVCESTPKKKTPRALTGRPPTSIPQNKTIVYGHALASDGDGDGDGDGEAENEGEGESESESESSIETAEPDWGLELARLRGLAEKFNTPTRAAAQEIKDAADALLEACTAHEARDAEAARLAAAEKDRAALLVALNEVAEEERAAEILKW